MNEPKPSSRLPYRIGVGAMIINTEGRVFVAQRIDTPGDAWQMPQGGIDEGEDPSEAVFREVEEEIGTTNMEIIGQSSGWLVYDIPEPLRASLWGGKYRGQKQKWYLMRFQGNDADVNLDHHHHPEFSSWKWAALNDVIDLIVPFKRPLYAQIVGEFSDQVRRMAGKDKTS
ncbi:MAG: RNA pyrophosphohydrolase [Rhodospirillaceae bacterium]|nr:RNA pyrophosphohydrolase [Rhodospirillaceae bacterium]